jgi:hypothetical protein
MLSLLVQGHMPGILFSLSIQQTDFKESKINLKAKFFYIMGSLDILKEAIVWRIFKESSKLAWSLHHWQDSWVSVC